MKIDAVKPGNRPLVLMGIQSDLVQRDFVDSGILDHIGRHVDLCFVVGSKAITEAVSPYGTVLGMNNPPPFARFMWDSSYHALAISRWERIVGRMGRQWFTRKNQPSWNARTLTGRVVASAGLGDVYGKLISMIFRLVNWRTMPLAPKRRLSLVIVPTITRDLFADELIRYARRVGVPSLALQVNLDAFNVKASIETPDVMALWGEQSWYLSRLGTALPGKKLRVLGTPRYEHYRRIDAGKARRALGYDRDETLILFAGSTAAFREIDALRTIDSAIDRGILPRNTRIIYKPHPKGQEDRDQPTFAESEFAHVGLYQSSSSGRWTDLGEYPALLSAVDAVITPYSTMAFEAALMGLPVLCLGYHEGVYESYWVYAREFFHLRIFHDRKFAVQCHKAEDLTASLQNLAGLIGDPEVRDEAMHAARSVVYRGAQPYETRLLGLIMETIGADGPARTDNQSTSTHIVEKTHADDS